MLLKKLKEIPSKIKKWILANSRSLRFCAVLTVPIVLYGLPLLLTGKALAPGDADYLMQTVEAARTTILEYGQFPWWNPWISGGVPLFANPQFGLVSFPSLLGLAFGSILGYKVALIAYLIMGFWGFYLLFTRCFSTPKTTAALLGYIWTFGSFFAHRAAGHYTFFTIEFLPIILLLFLKRHTIRYSWAWLGLSLGLMINAAAHNTTVMALAVFGLFVFIELFKVRFQLTKKRAFRLTTEVNTLDLKYLLMAGGVALLAAGPRLLYTLDYLREYPRNLASFPEETVGLAKGLFAMFGPIRQYFDMPSIPNWSWMEVSAYIGFFTAVAGAVVLVAQLKERSLAKARIGKISPLLIMMMGVVFFLFGLGMIAGDISPYNILRHLPIFSEMRVASRWFIWASMMTLVFIALHHSDRYRRSINVLLLISVCELFAFGSFFMAKPYTIPPADYADSVTINQQVHYDNKRSGAIYDENLTATTRANIGQIIAGDALIDTRHAPPFGANTIRCDSDATGCGFVLSANAKVVTWSPNHILLKRTGGGPVKLNMNPGKYWLVNNEYPFWKMKLSEPDKEFIITDKEATIEIKLQPKYSPSWVGWKISLII